VGTIPNTCPSGQQYDGLLCYPQCAAGYAGVGPVCWQSCPSGWRDDGAFCYKPDSYGRGVGYISESLCRQHYPSCENYWGLWYQKCGAGFYPVGCCVCSPVCLAGMVDIGISCAKLSYGRGVGAPAQCQSGLQYDAGLCYKQCAANSAGVGPVCWYQCPAGTTDCAALCVKSTSTCTKEVLDMATATMKAVVDLYMSLTPQAAAQAALDLMKAYGYPICA
jgi:hypothetical protein